MAMVEKIILILGSAVVAPVGFVVGLACVQAAVHAARDKRQFYWVIGLGAFMMIMSLMSFLVGLPDLLTVLGVFQ